MYLNVFYMTVYTGDVKYSGIYDRIKQIRIFVLSTFPIG